MNDEIVNWLSDHPEQSDLIKGEDWIEQAQNLFACYYPVLKSYLPNIRSAETKIEFMIGKVKMLGFIDILFNEGTVCDIKTSGRTPSSTNP